MEKYQYIALKDIQTNPYQPRKEFSEEKITELANSIKEHGIIQPIIVRKSPIIGYELLAGERRFKAAKLAGLTNIPAIIKEMSDEEMMIFAVLENLQREDLSSLEEAESYKNLMDKMDLTQEELAKKLEIPVDKVKNILEMNQDPISLETPVGSEEDSELGDFVEDDKFLNPYDATTRVLLKEQLDEILKTLNEREEMVLRYRYGLDDGSQKTLEEVGKIFNVTRERIRQIEVKALRKLRHPSRRKKLEDYRS